MRFEFKLLGMRSRRNSLPRIRRQEGCSFLSRSCMTSMLLLIVVCLLRCNPSDARLSGPQSKQGQGQEQQIPYNDSNSNSNSNSETPSLTVSADIPPLQDTVELARLSGMVYDFKIQHATDCSSFSSIFESFMEREGELLLDMEQEQEQEQVHNRRDESESDLDEELEESSHDENVSVNDNDHSIHINENDNSAQRGNFTYQCHMYERDKQDTQVLIVSRLTMSTTRPESNMKQSTTLSTDPNQDYIAVVYAGTDDFRNAFTDTNLLTKHFGPASYDDNDDDNDNDDTNKNNSTTKYNFPPFTDNIRVHAGFNNAVFGHQLFDRIYDQLSTFTSTHPQARIVTTGHSLGASDAVLTAVALKLQPQFSNHVIHSINFGCPKTGNRHWRELVNMMDGLGIWRVVNGLDLVPRLPGSRFHHVGHTVQLDKRMARGYWLHEGDRSLGYKGIPFGWNTLPYTLAPIAAYGHLMSHYSAYLKKSMKNPERYYISGFEKIHGDDSDNYYTDDTDNDHDHDHDHDNDNNDADKDKDKDDTYYIPPDEDLDTGTTEKFEYKLEFTREYIEQYMEYAQMEAENDDLLEEDDMLASYNQQHTVFHRDQDDDIFWDDNWSNYYSSFDTDVDAHTDANADANADADANNNKGILLSAMAMQENVVMG